jgi:hypothetical protein
VFYKALSRVERLVVNYVKYYLESLNTIVFLEERVLVRYAATL